MSKSYNEYLSEEENKAIEHRLDMTADQEFDEDEMEMNQIESVEDNESDTADEAPHLFLPYALPSVN